MSIEGRGWSPPREERTPDEPVPAVGQAEEIVSILEGLEGELQKRGLLGEHLLAPEQARDLSETLRKVLPQ